MRVLSDVRLKCIRIMAIALLLVDSDYICRAFVAENIVFPFYLPSVLSAGIYNNFRSEPVGNANAIIPGLIPRSSTGII